MKAWKSPVDLHQSCDAANPERFCEQLLEIYIRIVVAPLIYGEPHFHSIRVLIRYSTTIKLIPLLEIIKDLIPVLEPYRSVEKLWSALWRL